MTAATQNQAVTTSPTRTQSQTKPPNPTQSKSRVHQPWLSLNVLTVMATYLIVTLAISLIFTPPSTRSRLLPTTLLFFNYLNLFIAYQCETTLGTHLHQIKQDYTMLQEKYKGKEWDACVAFLRTPFPNWTSVGDCRVWCRMWSTYSLYDPSYQNEESFGFFIDLGNGYSTIGPMLLVNAAIMFGTSRHGALSEEPQWWQWWQSPLVVGCVGLASYWQITYGALIYLLSFVFNRRYRGKSLGGVLAFVGVANSLWIVFPVFGIYASVCMLRDGDFSVFGGA